MQKLTLHSGKPYDILIGEDLLLSVGNLILDLAPYRRAVIVTDSNVGPLYAPTVGRSLARAGVRSETFEFEAGEQSKRLDTIAQMYNCFADSGLTRSDVVIALGGGVTGDMAGFAAATYLRGIDYIQLPTSLLSQIDSSVGGKTGVDLDCGKNLVGAFHQPRLVLCDTATLETLPPAFFADGMAEAVKYGCIKSKTLFRLLEDEQIGTFLPEMITACIDIKRGVVERDEFESGERMLLNFGHTLGHSIEKYYHYTGMTHGMAVGIGMVLAAKAGIKSGFTPAGTDTRIESLLQKFGLPISDSAPLADLIDGSANDKKRSASGINFVLLKEIGEAFILSVPSDIFREFIMGAGQ